jgi:hypothetical protein
MPDWGSGAGGALTGAATGATIGSLVPGIGTAIGAGVGGVIGGIGGLFGGDDQAQQDEAKRKQLLQQQAEAAGGFANYGENNYRQFAGQGKGALAALQAQANGQNSVSQEQLRQSLGQMLAQQRSLAAGASPQNAALAARTAAIQSGRLASGMAGQQAIAGLAERNQAQQAYGNLLGQLSGQASNVALGSRQTATSGYGAGNAGAPAPSWIQQWGPPAVGALSAYAALNRPTTMSDRLLKTDIKPGDAPANKAIDALKAYAYRYKDPQYGAGPQVGVMAQDLERAGLKQAVIDTPGGKAIDPGKLAGANTAMIAALGRRVAELEGGAPRRSVVLEEVRPTSTPESDPAAWAGQRALDVRRTQLYQPDGRLKTPLESVEGTDPRAAAAQRALSARRAELDTTAPARRAVQLQEVTDPRQTEMLRALDRRVAARAQ